MFRHSSLFLRSFRLARITPLPTSGHGQTNYCTDFALKSFAYSTTRKKNATNAAQRNEEYLQRRLALRKRINEKMQITLDMAVVKNLSARETLNVILDLGRRLTERRIDFDAETYEMLLSAYSKAGMRHKVLPLLQEMADKGIIPTQSFFHKSLQLAARFGDAPLQALILEAMKHFGVEKISSTYRYLLYCMRNNGECERLVDTLDKMEKEGIKPILYDYLYAIDMCTHYNHPELAYQYLRKAEKLDTFSARDQFLYMRVLRCAALNDAYDVVKETWYAAVVKRNMEPDEGICQHVLHIAAKHDDPELGSHAFRLLGKMGYPYREPHVIPLLEVFASRRQWKNAFRLFITMRNAGLKPSRATAKAVVRFLNEDRNAARLAFAVLEELHLENAADIAAVNLVLHGLAHDPDPQIANQAFEKVKTWGLELNIETIDAVLDACILNKDAARGIQVFESYIPAKFEPTVTTLSKMVTLMCTQDNYEDAFVYLEKMKSARMIPLRGCYYRLVKRLASANDPRLQAALEEMQACGYEITNFLQGHLKKHRQNVPSVQESAKVASLSV